MGFQDLNVSKQILMALEEAGFENPTPIQEEVFSVSRSGRDLIGIAQTGTGKTLAYLIPMLMKLHYAQGLVPRALVIVPTRELVVQVCESVELLMSSWTFVAWVCTGERISGHNKIGCSKEWTCSWLHRGVSWIYIIMVSSVRK